MNGLEYEYVVADYLKKHGYSKVVVTKGSGDYGVDVIANKGKHKYAVQCKLYSSPVGLSAIQEAVAGKAMYGCTAAMVVTNSTFTNAARKLASANAVVLLEHISPKGKKAHRHSNFFIKAMNYYICFVLLITGMLVIYLNKKGMNSHTVSQVITSELIITSPFLIYLLFKGIKSLFLWAKDKRVTNKKENQHLNDSSILQVQKELLAPPQSVPIAPVKLSPDDPCVVALANRYKDKLKGPLSFEALKIFISSNGASVSLLQRRLRLKYAQAIEIVDELEQLNLIGPHEGPYPRKLLIECSLGPGISEDITK